MPFRYILANLLSSVDGAVGVLFLDDSGETIDLACSEVEPYEMQVLGAYLGLYLRQVSQMLEGSNLGEGGLIHIEKDSLHLYALPLPDGYCLALAQRPPAMVTQARLHLTEAASLMAREVFA